MSTPPTAKPQGKLTRHLDLGELSGFLEAVADRYEDDLPRLALADWAEDKAVPALSQWAQFIRADVEACRLRGATPDADPEGHARLVELRDTLRRLRPEVVPEPYRRGRAACSSRGFLAPTAEVSWGAESSTSDLPDRHVWLTAATLRLSLYTYRSDATRWADKAVADVGGLPEFSRLSGLVVRGATTLTLPALLERAPCVPRLRRLEVAGPTSDQGPALLTALDRGADLRELRGLHVTWTPRLLRHRGLAKAALCDVAPPVGTPASQWTAWWHAFLTGSSVPAAARHLQVVQNPYDSTLREAVRATLGEFRTEVWRAAFDVAGLPHNINLGYHNQGSDDAVRAVRRSRRLFEVLFPACDPLP